MTNRRFVSVSQMRKIDKKAVQYGISIEMMMENAGKEIANWIDKKVKKSNMKILCVAGKGNNGGGIISAARHLTCLGYTVSLIILYDKKLLSEPSKFHLSLIRKNPQIKIIYAKKTNMDKVFSDINKAHIIVDGIFGTGFRSSIKEPIFSIISSINQSKAYIVSNDVPSGIFADSGNSSNISIKPDFVIVLHRPKLWMKNAKIKHKTVSLGIPPEIG